MADKHKNGTRENNDVSGDSAEEHDSSEEMISQLKTTAARRRQKENKFPDLTRAAPVRRDSSRTTKAKSTAETSDNHRLGECVRMFSFHK